MSDYTNDAIYGYTGGNTLGADMLNPGAASSSVDWNAVLTSGIRGAAQGAIAAQVSGAYASGQLVQAQAVQQQKSSQLMTMLIIGGVLFMLTRG